MRFRGKLLGLILLLAADVMAGCTMNNVPVTGGGGPTAQEGQSETSVTVGSAGKQSIVNVSFNDETGTESTIQYTPTSRIVQSGASLMGWSYSTDGGNTWAYGGKVSPPKDWPILWGDPASTTSRTNPAAVFISNLAVPAANYPAGGVVSQNGGSGFYTALGGACIAKSKDGGKTFAIYQCIDNAQHFYDGGSMAAGPDGSIYAAYVDTVTSQIDVWKAANENGVFTLMPPPFPNLAIGTHPRLRVDQNGSQLYVAAQAENQVVFITRFLGPGWDSPVPASNPIAWYPTINLADRVLRTGPQFTFDVSSASVLGGDEVRVIYTAFDSKSNRYVLMGSRCPLALGTCFDVPPWATTNANFTTLQGDQFNPSLRAFAGTSPNTPAEWKLTYLSRQEDPTGNSVIVQQGNLAVIGTGTPVRILFPFKLINPLTVCPDTRGYWGDYEGLELLGVNQNAPTFLAAFTDSSQGCTQQWEYTSSQVHVSATPFQ